MNKIRKKLLENKGEVSLDLSVRILVTTIIVVLAITVFAVFNKMSVLNSVSHEMMRYIELRGMIDDAVYNEFTRLQAASGLDCELLTEADFIGSTQKIQFGDSLEVKVKAKTKIGVGGILSIEIPISSRASGRSERYWK